MSEESPTADDGMVTVLVADDINELALAESILRELGVLFVTRNVGVQHLVGAGLVGGFNVATGPPEIQVFTADAPRAIEILREALGQGETVADPAEPESLAPSPDLTRYVEGARYSRCSAVWALFWLGGLGSLLAIYFGIKALSLHRGAPTLSNGLALSGTGLGVYGLACWLLAWGVSLAP